MASPEGNRRGPSLVAAEEEKILARLPMEAIDVACGKQASIAIPVGFSGIARRVLVTGQ